MSAPLTDEAIRQLTAEVPGVIVDAEAFRAHVAQAKLEPDANLADVLLAWSSLRGDRRAMAELERRLARVATPILGRYGDAAFAEDVLQEVREKLLVGSRAKLKAYAGRGALVQYLKTVVTTAAIDKSRTQKSGGAQGDDDDELASVASSERNADSMIMQKRGNTAFSRAFKEALSTLSAEERTLLRMKFVDGVSVEDIGRTFQVHRTTAMRWIEKVQAEVLELTRKKLKDELRLKDGELETVMKEMELSISARLSMILPAFKRSP